jgi:hypothetical protein
MAFDISGTGSEFPSYEMMSIQNNACRGSASPLWEEGGWDSGVRGASVPHCAPVEGCLLGGDPLTHHSPAAAA